MTCHFVYWISQIKSNISSSTASQFLPTPNTVLPCSYLYDLSTASGWQFVLPWIKSDWTCVASRRGALSGDSAGLCRWVTGALIVPGGSRVMLSVAALATLLRSVCGWYYFVINPLAPELFFFILAHPVYKMWIIQEPNKLALWNKLHFEEKNGECRACLKYSYLYLLNKYIKCNVWRLAVRYDPYMGR